MMRIERLSPDFSVCRVKDFSGVDISGDFVFTAKTDDEYSLVCPAEIVPEIVIEREDHWTGFRIVGVLDFSLIGILADISSALAAEGISIFEYDPKGKVALAYQSLTDEVLANE